MKRLLLCVAAITLSSISASAMILFGAGNNETTSDPDNGIPWDSVVRTNDGTAVHLGNGYFLTANHVISNDIFVFDEASQTEIKYTTDTSFGTDGKIQIGGVDLKIFKVSDPEILKLDYAILYDEILPEGTDIYHVGAGIGRGSAPLNTADTQIGVGGSKTVRWGTNEAYHDTYKDLFLYMTIANAPPYGVDPFDYKYEAGLTSGDSGSPMFVQILDKWYVAGIAFGVSDSGSYVVFSNGSNASINYMLRSTDYYDEIYAIVPFIPEPSEIAVIFGFCAMAFAICKRKKKRTA